MFLEKFIHTNSEEKLIMIFLSSNHLIKTLFLQGKLFIMIKDQDATCSLKLRNLFILLNCLFFFFGVREIETNYFAYNKSNLHISFSVFDSKHGVKTLLPIQKGGFVQFFR